MRRGLRALAAVGLGLAVSVIAACGSSSGLLSSSDASTLQQLLNQVSADVGARNCSALQADLNSLAQASSNLPSSVSSALRANLAQAFDKVSTTAQQHCSGALTTPTTTTTSTTTKTKTKTTPTSTTTTSTTPTQTVTTPPTTTATPPPNTGTTSTGPPSGGTGLGNQGGNGGGGNGGGNGNGH